LTTRRVERIARINREVAYNAARTDCFAQGGREVFQNIPINAANRHYINLGHRNYSRET
jgi:hypothetical protein